MRGREKQIPQAFGACAGLEILDMRIDRPGAEALGGQIQLALDRIEMRRHEILQPVLQDDAARALSDVHVSSS